MGMVSRVVHFEIPVEDATRAGAFYGEVFDWNVVKWGTVEYWPMLTGETGGPGAEGALTPRSEAREGVLVYIAVENIDEAVKRVTAAGGTEVDVPQMVPGVGWRARFRDPEGNLLGLFQDDTAAGASHDGASS
jgi:predicted enzyme related to lactoylglutathione lyase